MKYQVLDKKDTRSGFGAGLTELADTHPNVVALCADLIGSLKMEKFIEKAPEMCPLERKKRSSPLPSIVKGIL